MCLFMGDLKWAILAFNIIQKWPWRPSYGSNLKCETIFPTNTCRGNIFDKITFLTNTFFWVI
jgi:hypothetical protein